jgi:hypothetical protein
VIGPIGKDGTVERKHADLLLHSLIKHVLENNEFNYRVKRADEDADPGMIGDRVVTDIIQAPLVVADLTDLNPNAFYELGIRHSTELPTIHVARAGTDLPFDNVAHRTIFVDLSDWHSLEHARARLADSIRAINDPGYKVSNPITQANASFKMRQSDDPRDRLFADLQYRLTSIESRLTKSASKPLVDSKERIRDYVSDHLIGIAMEQREIGLSDDRIIEILEAEAASSEDPPEKMYFDKHGGLTIEYPNVVYSSPKIGILPKK